MRWAESESAAKHYVRYLDELIEKRRVEITHGKPDSLAHVLRAVIKGMWKRQQAPYSGLYRNSKVRVQENVVVLELDEGSVAENLAAKTPVESTEKRNESVTVRIHTKAGTTDESIADFSPRIRLDAAVM